MKRKILVVAAVAAVVSFGLKAQSEGVVDPDKETVEAVSSDDECPISHKIVWNKYTKEYTITFNNSSRYAVDVWWEFWNGDKWVAANARLGRGSDGGWPAGPEGRVRNFEWNWAD